MESKCLNAGGFNLGTTNYEGALMRDLFLKIYKLLYILHTVSLVWIQNPVYTVYSKRYISYLKRKKKLK